MNIFNFGFPYTNAHQLNLDWILEYIQTLPHTVNNTGPDENGNVNLPNVSGMSSWNGIGADGAGNVDPLEFTADLNNAAEGLHFYKWDNPNTDNNPYGAAENLGYMAGWGGGICISSKTSNGYAVQLAINNGDTCIAMRSLAAGDPWDSWKYINIYVKAVSSSITLNPSVVDLNSAYNIDGMTAKGFADIYLEVVTAAAAGNNDVIATGLPIPANSYSYTMGMIQDANTGEFKPCRFFVNASGNLTFSYAGEASNAGDKLFIHAIYPLA